MSTSPVAGTIRPRSNSLPSRIKRPRLEMSLADRGWKPFRDPYWVDFHKRWWGQNGKTRLESIKKDRMLEVTPYEEIWLELSLLRTSRGWLYVREEYELMYDRMVIASANRDVPGVVMTGQSGIGISSSIIYNTLRQIADKREVALTTSRSYTFLFNSFGVWGKYTSSIDLAYDLHTTVPGAHRVWSLVDSVQTEDSLMRVTSIYNFYVVFTSDLSRFWYLIDHEARLWVMSPWTDHELHALFTSNATSESMKVSLDTFEKVRTARIQYGPCPRDIMKTSRSAHEVEVARAVKILCDNNKIWDLFTIPFHPFTDAIFHRLVLVRRRGAIDVSRICGDNWSTHINGETTYKALHAHLTMDKVQDLISGRPGAWRGAASFSRFLFESLAIGFLSGDGPAECAFRATFARMTEEGTRHTASPRRFAYSHPEASVTLSVTETRHHQLLRGTVPSLPSDTCSSPTTMETLPCRLGFREIVRFERLEDIHDIDITTSLCVPSPFTSPFFDAFFVEKEDQKTIAWFCQIAVIRDRDGAGGGFEMVQEVVEKVAKARSGIPVHVKYVLVIPRDTWAAEDWAVRWSLPREFSTFEGDVYVQYLEFPSDVVELVQERSESNA